MRQEPRSLQHHAHVTSYQRACTRGACTAVHRTDQPAAERTLAHQHRAGTRADHGQSASVATGGEIKIAAVTIGSQVDAAHAISKEQRKFAP